MLSSGGAAPKSPGRRVARLRGTGPRNLRIERSLAIISSAAFSVTVINVGLKVWEGSAHTAVPSAGPGKAGGLRPRGLG